MAKRTSPTARVLKHYRDCGFHIEVVERWLPRTLTRKDFIGCVDLIAIKPGVGIVGVQATSRANHASRRNKAKAEPLLRTWLASGGRFEVASTAKQGERGKRKLWNVKREELVAADLTSDTIGESEAA